MHGQSPAGPNETGGKAHSPKSKTILALGLSSDGGGTSDPPAVEFFDYDDLGIDDDDFG